MACGEDREIEIGTDEYFDFLCSVCKGKKKKTEGKYLCLDCNDYYCFDCVKCHEEIPFLKDHKVLGTEMFKPGSKIQFQALPEHEYNETNGDAKCSGNTVSQTEPGVSPSEFVEVNDIIVIKKANFERMQRERIETTEQTKQILLENQHEIQRQKNLNQDLSIDRDRKVEALTERLQELEKREKNAEDKLMAAKARKAMLQEEIVTFEVTQAKMSMQIAKSKAECANLKERLCRLEEDFTQKSKIQTEEMEQNLSDLVAAVSEKQSLQEENSDLKYHGSMSIIKQSWTHIKERLEKKENQCRSLEKEMKTREQGFLEREREMRRETENLREKILMCGEEYKALYIEKEKVEKKMESLETKLKETQEKNEPLLKKFNEELQEKEAEIARLKMTIRDIPNDWDFKVRALEIHLTQIKEGLEKKENQCRSLENEMKTREQGFLEREREMRRETEDLREKILMCGEEYKALYIEKEKVEKKMESLATKLKEKQEKNEPLLKEVNELQEKEAEIALLKMTIRDIPNDWDLKVRALEKRVTEKEMIIDDLNKKKLRVCSDGNKDEKNISPRRSASFQMENKRVWNATIQSPRVPVVYPAAGRQVGTPVMRFPVRSTSRSPSPVYSHPTLESQVAPVRSTVKIPRDYQAK